MLKVLFYQFFPGGGIARYTDALASHLQEIPDVEVSVLCSPAYEYLRADKYRCVPELMPLQSKLAVIRRSRFLLAQYINPMRLIRHASRSRPDVIHFSNINYLLYPVYRSRLQALQIPFVCTAHDVRRAARIIHRGTEERHLKQFYRDCAAIFVHSEHQKRELMEFAHVPSGNIALTPHGPYPYPQTSTPKHLLRAKYGIPENRVVLLCFGAIRDDKNLHRTIQATSQVTPRPFVIIAGRGGAGTESVNSLRQTAAAWGMSSDVLFVDRYIPDEEVSAFFQMSDATLLTYSDTFSSQSGVLNVSVAFQKPVICTQSPTISETVKQYEIGTVCKSDHLADIAEGLTTALHTLRSADANAFERYNHAESWSRAAQTTVCTYNNAHSKSQCQ